MLKKRYKREGFITLWFYMFCCIIFSNVDTNICFSVFGNIHEKCSRNHFLVFGMT